MSELFREAFRSYRAEQVRKRLEAGHKYARGRSRTLYTQDDVEGLVDEARAELATERPDRR